MNWLKYAGISILLLLTVGCERLIHEGDRANGIPGFFLLNEGQEGNNNCRLDFYDYATGIYSRNIFEERNQELMNSIGDVGTDMALCGDSLYVYSNSWNYFTQSSEIQYAIVDVKTHQVVTRNFITDGTDQQIQTPYGIAVNPQTREILVTDARDSVTPGKLYCFSPEGRLKWSVTTGDNPSRIVFTHTPLL